MHGALVLIVGVSVGKKLHTQAMHTENAVDKTNRVMVRIRISM